MKIKQTKEMCQCQGKHYQCYCDNCGCCFMDHDTLNYQKINCPKCKKVILFYFESNLKKFYCDVCDVTSLDWDYKCFCDVCGEELLEIDE